MGGSVPGIQQSRGSDVVADAAFCQGAIGGNLTILGMQVLLPLYASSSASSACFAHPIPLAPASTTQEAQYG
eukprot:487809-Pelagomonas_calceolata.AAC.2